MFLQILSLIYEQKFMFLAWALVEIYWSTKTLNQFHKTLTNGEEIGKKIKHVFANNPKKFVLFDVFYSKLVDVQKTSTNFEKQVSISRILVPPRVLILRLIETISDGYKSLENF